MTEPPRFGRLERLRGNGRWVTTKRFYTRQLEKGKLRYVHTKGNPATDSFRFVVSVQGIVAAGDVAEDGPSGAVSANDHLAKDTFNINIISNTIRPKRQVSGVILSYVEFCWVGKEMQQGHLMWLSWAVVVGQLVEQSLQIIFHIKCLLYNYNDVLKGRK